VRPYRQQAAAWAGVVLIACARGEGVPAVAADSLLVPGDSLYARGAFDSAASLWEVALVQPGIAGSPTEARLFHRLGLAAYRRGEYADARRLGERSLERKRELRLRRAEIAESENALGLLAWNEGRLADARSLLSAALRGFESDTDRSGVAKSSNNLALVSLELGRFADARDGFEIARTAARETGNVRVEGRATTNLAMIEIWSGDPTEAPPLLETSRRLADSVSDPVGLENALGQMAVAWQTMGEPGRALAMLDSATAVARRYGLREEEANDLLVAASIYRDAGDADRALQLYGQARAINETLGLAVEAGMILRHQAAVRLQRGAIEQARADAEQALALHRQAGARLEELADLLAMARIETEAVDLAAAARRLGEARRLATGIASPQTTVNVALVDAFLADRGANPEAVLRALAGIADDLALSSASANVEAEWLRTRAYASTRQLDSAVAAGRRAVAAIDRARNTLGSPMLRGSIVAERTKVYADLTLALLQLGQDEEAFMVADAARGRAFVDLLASARDVARRSPAGRDLAERDRLLRRIDALLSRLEAVRSRPLQERAPDDEAAGRELVERLAEARAEYAAVLDRIVSREPHRAALLGAAHAPVAALKALMRPDDVLLQYFMAADRLVVFVLSHHGLATVNVPIPSEQLENRVRLARALIGAKRRTDSASVVLEELHRLLIGPVHRLGMLDSARRLLVVPHGVLSYLPFAALRDPATGRRLVRDHSLQVLPSAAALPAMRAGRGTVPWSGKATVLAPFPGELPATETEASAVASALSGGRYLTGGGATELELRRALTAGDMVHVATHGIMNAANPLFSHVRLTRGRSGAPEDDGRFEVHELFGLSARSPLVFLSGCETGLGVARTTPFERHEDFTTLAQAFLLAGAGSVVATLWRIDDEGAAQFAERFYGHLRSMTAVEALAATQRDLARDVRWGHPYYWAGYTISGDEPEGITARRPGAAVSR
jgi:CHAT domain-containing protein/Tfp pilus assembly protein PilF